ncbi:hypothetical protein COV19_07130 [Candidatus Woesearchaeota archaeon CG10_big_fil_rev_8_21_14_0_10_44_13]|nr:MAG: hypothetical protein COV19_07130 [Candidatus Woesearchaeota archaeon CG10_big_fil_rev_8_21_14_0_10_44_13]
MLTKEQIKIIGCFKRDISIGLTFRQIKEQLRQKSNNLIQIALKEFKKQGLIKTKETGDVTTYFLNLDNNLTLSYLNLVNELEISKNKMPVDVLKRIQAKVSGYTEFFILIVFGSHVKGKAKEKSDLDIAIIVESEKTKKEVSPYLETIKRREILRIDYHIMTRDEFLEMLKVDYENLGKQIYKNNIVYYGFIEYLNLIRGK